MTSDHRSPFGAENVEARAEIATVHRDPGPRQHPQRQGPGGAEERQQHQPDPRDPAGQELAGSRPEPWLRGRSSRRSGGDLEEHVLEVPPLGDQRVHLDPGLHQRGGSALRARAPEPQPEPTGRRPALRPPPWRSSRPRPAGGPATAARPRRSGSATPPRRAARRRCLRPSALPPSRMPTRLQIAWTSAEQVRRQEHRDLVVERQGPDQVPHLAHPGRVEAVRGLVEQQQPGIAEQRPRDRQPLAHPERVPAGRVLARVR